MATERQSPGALLDQTNLSGAVTAIQDDPDTPDSSWLTAISNNADSICRTSFPTPTGNPTVGADLQEFKIWVRKMGGTGTPLVRIELYENNVFLATLLADTGVTSTSGVLHSGTWDANLLGTANGSLVECRVYGTKSGGAPTARAAIEVGAVEWNVEYSAGVVVIPTPISAIGGIVAPTVILGSISIIAQALSAIAQIVNPTVILGSLLLTPSPASAIGDKVDPTIPTGITVTPTPIFALGSKVDPTVILGSLVITPSGLGAIGAKVDPIIVLGSIIIIPSILDVIGGSVNPTVQIQTVIIYVLPAGVDSGTASRQFTYQLAGKKHRKYKLA